MCSQPSVIDVIEHLDTLEQESNVDACWAFMIDKYNNLTSW